MLYFPRQLFQSQAFLEQGWQGLFEKEAPLNLEIGCGYGHFLIYMAQKYPEQNFIGLDIVNKILRKVEKRIENAELDNALACKIDANLVLRELFPEGSLDNLYILFPDPWFKDRHQDRRMVRTENLPLFVKALKTGGVLHFVSDDPPYAAQAKELLDSVPEFEPAPFPDIEIKTKYEKKWLKQNKTIARYAYRKKSPTEPQEWPQQAKANWALSLAPNPNTLLKKFKPNVYKAPDLVLRVKNAYQNPLNTHLLFQMVLAEPAQMAHEFFVEVDAEGVLSIPQGSYLPRILGREKVMQACLAVIAAL